MPSHSDIPNPDLLDRIPLDARIVLDVGCATGALGAEYKRRNPVAQYFGIEPDPAAARTAATRLDRVAEADIEGDPHPFADQLRPGGVDCIIFGDVLEHLRDPWAVLRRYAQLLSENGTLLACIPNMEHWSFAERLLRGTWDYEAQGLFDSTHLRWFGFQAMRRAFQQAGLVVHDGAARATPTDEAEAFVQAIEPGLVRLGIDPQAYLRRATPLQFVWRARRRPVQPVSVVSTMLAPVGGVSHVRVIEPMRAMASDPGLATQIVPRMELPPAADAMPRIYIFHRPLLAGDSGLEAVRELTARGYIVVCEFDDHPDYIAVLQRDDVQNFRAVHAVQTTTEPLAEVLRRQNPEVMVFPNGVFRLPDVRNYASPDHVTLFFGGLNREEDWPPYLPALNAVAAMAGSRLHFQIVNDRGLFEALETPHKNFTPLCDYETYQELLSRCEVSFMPLKDTPFNRCKSDLKFLEAAAYRVTALASPVVYGDTVQDGRTGILFQDANDLQQRLTRLIASPELGRTIGGAARSYVAGERMLAYQVARRTAWYRSLWARRDELHRALLARVPELAPKPVLAEAPASP
jgi:SAM-dependent methyltransferase